jgi:CheY-like chemotaxis protein
MKKPRILIVEDEPDIAELVAVNLRHNGFSPVWAEDGAGAQLEIDAVLPDAILLDWMLPGQSGLALARRWRSDPRTKAIPLLMITARGDEPDKVAGLDAGADDYITKPFSTQELLARIRAVLRRRAPEQASESVSVGRAALAAGADRVQVAQLPDAPPGACAQSCPVAGQGLGRPCIHRGAHGGCSCQAPAGGLGPGRRLGRDGARRRLPADCYACVLAGCSLSRFGC